MNVFRLISLEWFYDMGLEYTNDEIIGNDAMKVQ